jgi:prophage regulatory protein
MVPRILRRQLVEAQTGLSRSKIYDLVAREQFPRPVKIGARAVGWVEADIAAWINEKIEAAKREGRK